MATIAALGVLAASAGQRPTPTARQMQWMSGTDPIVGGFSQFAHFGINTFWAEGDKFDPNGTYHDCVSNAKYCDDESCGPYAPCLRPELFNPVNLSAEQWVLAAKELGVQEICLTAQHEGGFALWPSAYTNYSVASSPWKDGKGDVLRDFADACNKHGIVCYYLHPMCDHYSTVVQKVTPEQFSEQQVGKIREAVTKYGPVSRFWFDGKGKAPLDRYPAGLDTVAHFQKVLDTIRTLSPETLVTGYREWGGDIASSYQTLNLYDAGPPPNSTSVIEVGKPAENGTHFFPLEQVGICMQEGPDGNTNGSPTYWFYHPLVGHANASRIYDSWLHLVGHGEVGMINIPPDRNGQIPEAYVEVMATVGKGIRDTFTTPLASLSDVAGTCAQPVVLDIPKGTQFDYVQTKEDFTHSQLIMNYSVEYRTAAGPWLPLVPPVPPPKSSDSLGHIDRGSLRDRPAGADPRDSHVGFRRIDTPIIADTTEVSQIRFSCLRALEEQIYLKSFGVFKKNVPWEQ